MMYEDIKSFFAEILEKIQDESLFPLKHSYSIRWIKNLKKHCETQIMKNKFCGYRLFYLFHLIFSIYNCGCFQTEIVHNLVY